MADRRDRLRKLIVVQGKLAAIHETRHAGHVAAAHAARGEAEDVAERMDAEGSMASLFPELYNRRLTSARTRETASLEQAQLEAGHVATAKARGNVVDKAWRIENTRHERETADRERLERAARGAASRDK